VFHALGNFGNQMRYTTVYLPLFRHCFHFDKSPERKAWLGPPLLEGSERIFHRDRKPLSAALRMSLFFVRSKAQSKYFCLHRFYFCFRQNEIRNAMYIWFQRNVHTSSSAERITRKKGVFPGKEQERFYCRLGPPPPPANTSHFDSYDFHAGIS
jgi:hypothetical protein